MLIKLSVHMNNVLTKTPKIALIFMIIVGLGNFIMPSILNAQKVVAAELVSFAALVETIPANTVFSQEESFSDGVETTIYTNQAYTTANKALLPNKALLINETAATIVINDVVYHAKFTTNFPTTREQIIYAIDYLADVMVKSSYISGALKAVFSELIFINILLLIIYFCLGRTEKYAKILAKILPLIGLVSSVCSIIYLTIEMPYLTYYLVTQTIATCFCLILYWDKYLTQYFMGRNSE
ncbi:MAG: hypothetical protein ACRC6X_01285 [Culicoidibacterales bacterium]